MQHYRTDGELRFAAVLRIDLPVPDQMTTGDVIAAEGVVWLDDEHVPDEAAAWRAAQALVGVGTWDELAAVCERLDLRCDLVGKRRPQLEQLRSTRATREYRIVPARRGARVVGRVGRLEVIARTAPCGPTSATATVRTPRERRSRSARPARSSGAAEGSEPPRRSRREPRPCENCGGVFEPSREAQAYCLSDACRRARDRAKKAAQRDRDRAKVAGLPDHESIVVAEIAAGQLTAEDGLLWVLYPDAMRRSVMYRVDSLAAAA